MTWNKINKDKTKLRTDTYSKNKTWKRTSENNTRRKGRYT